MAGGALVVAGESLPPRRQKEQVLPATTGELPVSELDTLKPIDSGD
jgi:hypothetical protein